MIEVVSSIKDLPKTLEKYKNKFLEKFGKNEIWNEVKPETLSYDEVELRDESAFGKEVESVDKSAYKHLPSHGTWSEEKGNSIWYPDKNSTPDSGNKKGGNPDGLTWGEILEKYGIEGIEYVDGEPNFDKVKIAEVTIDNFTEDRQKNFYQADKKLAEQWTLENKNGQIWTARDVAEWRKENGCTWHECKDCQTMQLTPKEIHNNTPHAGGISVIKEQNQN